MPPPAKRTKVFPIPLNRPGDVLQVRITTQGKQVLDFTVQYEATVEGQFFPIIRYDCAHGRPHRDTLDDRGRTIRKTWLSEHADRGRVLQDAIADLETNWQRYLDDFLRNRARAEERRRRGGRRRP